MASLCWSRSLAQFFFLLFLSATSLYAQEGEELFKAQCGACHRVDRKMTGPALKGVHERWGNNQEEMVAFIKASQDYMEADREYSQYATDLWNEYNQTVMPNQLLSDEQIVSILDYIEAETEKLNAPEPQVAQGPAGGGAGGGGGSLFSDSDVYYGLLALLGVMLLVALVLIVVIALLINAVRAKEEKSPFTWSGTFKSALAIAQNRFVLTLVVLVVVGAGLTKTVQHARGVGLHTGYQPVQPIAFSHKLHAGEYGISCNYCHIGVEKGKSATIPSTNICMNCHKYIVEDPEGDEAATAEIQKIHASWESGEPIEWVKVHNLPDHAYFNHAQHVKVGGLECTECHGQVEEMEEVYQVNSLGMGWCIDCHRNKKVAVNKSNYYRNVHDEYLGKEDSVTVEMLGGLNCARCHY